MSDLRYRDGLGVLSGVSHKRAFEWFERAALKGYTPAQTELVEIYKTGRGVRQSNIEARKWTKLAEAGRAAEFAERGVDVVDRDAEQAARSPTVSVNNEQPDIASPKRSLRRRFSMFFKIFRFSRTKTDAV